MCMKNVNTNIVFADIAANSNQTELSLQNIGKKFYIIEEERKITSLSFALFISASEEKDAPTSDSECEAKGLEDKSIFKFYKEYELRIRLTETISGDFMDLTELRFKPKDTAVERGICKKTFNYSKFFRFDNIKLPERKEKENFVIKVILRESIEENKNQWSVQSIHPIEFNNIC